MRVENNSQLAAELVWNEYTLDPEIMRQPRIGRPMRRMAA
jgi:hypothetical protein